MCKAKAIRKSHPYWRHAMQKYLSSIQLNKEKFNWMIFVVYTKENSNYMKKSKIIVPALGLLLLSTAASVSGTVAWFTAVRNFNATIGNTFAVVKTTGDLTCQFKGLVATTESTTDKTNDTLTVDAKKVLTDGSFDLSDLKAAYPTDSTGETFAETAALGYTNKATDEAVTGIKRGQTKNSEDIYTVFTWTMTFTNTTESAANYGLFFNLDAGQSEASASSTAAVPPSEAAKIAAAKKGFRVGFTDGSRSFVWAPFRSVGDTAELKYVSAVSDGAVTPTSYTLPTSSTPGNVICSDETNIAVMTSTNDGVSAAAVNTKANYVGTFTSSVTEIAYKCAAWYEGLDSSVVSSSDLAAITLKLSFDVRRLA